MFAVPPNTIAQSVPPASAHPALIALELAADIDRWSYEVRYHVGQRYSRLVATSEGQDLWLMSWLPGQATDLHRHPGMAGAFTVVIGTLIERTGERVHQVVPGQCRVFGPDYVHQLINEGPYPAVSIMCTARR